MNTKTDLELNAKQRKKKGKRKDAGSESNTRFI